MTGQFLMGARRVVWPYDLHQFDLFELMLAYHAAYILAVGTGLSANARRMWNEFNGMRLHGKYLFADQFVNRHLRRRNQIVRRYADELEQGILQLRKRARTAQTIRIDHERHTGLGVTVLLGLQIQHGV